MPTTGLSFERLIASKTRAEVRAALSATRFPLSLPQAQQLTSRLEELEPPTHTLRLGIVHTYTSELLDPWLGLAASVQGLALEVYHAPYGVTVQEAREDSGLVTHRPDVTLFLLRRDDLHPRLARPLVGLAPRDQEVLREEVMTRFSHMIGQFRRFKIGRLAVSLLPAAAPLGLGMYDSMSDRSENTWWATLKADIGQFLRRSVKSSVFLDLDDAAMECGRAAFFDRRLWYSARFPFAPEAAREVARRVLAIGALAKLPTAKVLVLDGDNTLWGGILGEDGFEGIALGPDYPGNAFMDFQRRLLDFQQRGFILALCSKNNEADVDQVLKDHPHQVLRDEHFAARRVNWIPKPDNLISLAEELNLGLDSFIFVDDSDHECAAVRHRLPQVEVIQTPARPTDVPGCLDRVARLEVLLLTEEDLTKTEMYVQERRRREMKDQIEQSGAGLAEYLVSLEMTMVVGIDDADHLARLTQLTQKTNQFNLTTRRYDERSMQEFMASDEWVVADFSLRDVFGDSGIVGLAMFRVSNEHAELDTFLMSCRVIGREAEAAFLECLLRGLASRGVTTVVADYLPTAKNALAKDFLPQRGFVTRPDGRYQRNLAEAPPASAKVFPIAVPDMECGSARKARDNRPISATDPNTVNIA